MENDMIFTLDRICEIFCADGVAKWAKANNLTIKEIKKNGINTDDYENDSSVRMLIKKHSRSVKNGR